MLSRFHLILERQGQTDRQTDGQTELLYQYRAFSRVSVLTRNKNRKMALQALVASHQILQKILTEETAKRKSPVGRWIGYYHEPTSWVGYGQTFIYLFVFILWVDAS